MHSCPTMLRRKLQSLGQRAVTAAQCSCRLASTGHAAEAIAKGPTLADFMCNSLDAAAPSIGGVEQVLPAAMHDDREPSGNAPAPPRKRAYVQTMGCQMNVNDTEVVLSILRDAGYDQTQDMTEADVVLVNTCAIREGAESRVFSWLGSARHTLLGAGAMSSMPRWQRAQAHAQRPVLGVLGCMAERLKGQLLDKEKLVDLVAGPDAYRDLPRLIAAVRGDGDDNSRQTAMNVQLSLEETYADILPMRPADATSAYLSIMRGCNNMCAFCIVPFTRGRERSRPVSSILDEVKQLSDSGFKEVTLLGQNVNSYADRSSAEATRQRQQQSDAASVYAEGFSSVYRPQRAGAVDFAELLSRVAAVDPEMRVRFTSPHPKEFSDDVLQAIAEHHNVCSQLHMPVQSGSTSVLQRMRRGYSREAYDALVSHVRERIPGVALSTDIIAGFCGETDEDHAATVDLMRRTAFDSAFMFAYSLREKTAAARHLQLRRSQSEADGYRLHTGSKKAAHIEDDGDLPPALLQDDVPAAVKAARLQEIIATYREGLHSSMQAEVGRRHLVLVQDVSKRDASCLTGRTDTMKRVVFPDQHMAAGYGGSRTPDAAAAAVTAAGLVRAKPGDYVAVEVVSATTGTLQARPLGRTSLAEFVGVHGSAALLPAAAAADTPLLRAVG